MAEKKEECVQVVVRCRPFNTKEKNQGCVGIIDMDLDAGSIVIRNPEDESLQPKPFTFDAVYDWNTVQKNFYEESCSALVDNVLEGFNGTIFAYGQTGCGKTWTMQGPNDPPELKGVIPNSFSHIFDFVKASTGVEFLVRCSYLEIYNEVVRDLLADHKLKDLPKCDIKEDPNKGVFVSNLTDVVVESEVEMDAVLNKGLHNRTVGATQMNAESSRSHSIFTIVVEMNTKDTETGKDHIRAGKLNLVDLAGSERQKKTGASGDRLKEGSKINLSLSALGNVISALSEGGAKHIPYRDSKLTRLLQDSLGGNTKTLMVAAISPADYNYDETLSTLRYANRAKNIKNKPKINEDPKDTMIREYKEEIEKLRKMLADQAAMLSGDPAALAAMQASFAAAHPTTQQIAHHHSTRGSDGKDDEDSVDFASLGAVSESSKKNSLRPPKSPRAVNEDPKSPRIIEKRVEVVVEKIPDEHLEHHKALENYSKAVEQERDKYGEQLRAAEDLANRERRARLELANRLEDMQRKLMGHSESTRDLAASDGGVPDFSGGVAEESGMNLSNYNFPVEDGAESPPKEKQSIVETEALAKEREAALVRIRERKKKAKKRADNKLRAEKERALKENSYMQEELDDLKEAATDSSQSKEQTEKKLLRLRKKYERKVAAMEHDRAELIEQVGIERDNMLDTIRDQQQDIKLYEQICRSLLSNKKMNQIIDKARWNEEDDEWTLPYFKADGDHNDGNQGRLPDINKDAVISPRAPSSGAPGIAFPRNIPSESKNYSPSGNGTLLPAFNKKGPNVRNSGDDQDNHMPSINGKQKKELQLPEFSNRTTLPSTTSAQISARSDNRDSRDSSPAEGEVKKKKKKKVYDEEKAKQALDGDTDDHAAGAVSDWGFAGSNVQGDDHGGEKKRRNKSSNGNRKSKDTADFTHLPGINGVTNKGGDISPKGYRNDFLPSI